MQCTASRLESRGRGSWLLTRGLYLLLSTNLQELEARSRNDEVSVLLLLADAAATEGAEA